MGIACRLLMPCKPCSMVELLVGMGERSLDLVADASVAGEATTLSVGVAAASVSVASSALEDPSRASAG